MAFQKIFLTEISTHDRVTGELFGLTVYRFDLAVKLLAPERDARNDFLNLVA